MPVGEELCLNSFTPAVATDTLVSQSPKHERHPKCVMSITYPAPCIVLFLAGFTFSKMTSCLLYHRM